MRLSEIQRVYLGNLHNSDQNWRAAKQGAIIRARVLVTQELEAYLLARDNNVRIAVKAGIPKRQIALEGLGTSSLSTLEESLARTAGPARAQKELGEAAPPVHIPYCYPPTEKEYRP